MSHLVYSVLIAVVSDPGHTERMPINWSVRSVFNAYQATVSELNKPDYGPFERPLFVVRSHRENDHHHWPLSPMAASQSITNGGVAPSG
jgi:hypothetical protein